MIAPKQAERVERELRSAVAILLDTQSADNLLERVPELPDRVGRLCRLLEIMRMEPGIQGRNALHVAAVQTLRYVDQLAESGEPIPLDFPYLCAAESILLAYLTPEQRAVYVQDMEEILDSLRAFVLTPSATLEDDA